MITPDTITRILQDLTAGRFTRRQIAAIHEVPPEFVSLLARTRGIDPYKRDHKGRFRKGTKGGPGRPRRHDPLEEDFLDEFGRIRPQFLPPLDEDPGVIE